MSLGYPNEEGGRSSQGGFFHAFGSIFSGFSISGFRVRQDSPLGLSVRFGGETGVDDSLFLKDNDNHTYPVFNPDKQPISAEVTPANASNPRVDAAIIYIDNTEDPTQDVYDNSNKVKAAVIPGTPGTSPSAPNNSQILAVIGANSWYKVMAEINVPAGTVTSITDAMIVDKRVSIGLPDGIVKTDTLASSAVTTQKMADGAATTAKMKPTYSTTSGNSGGSRQDVIGATTAVVTGLSKSYTAGSTNELLLIRAEVLIKAATAGGQFFIAAGGTPISKSDYLGTAGDFRKMHAICFYEIAAGATVTIDARFLNVGGTATIANSSADQTNTPSYGGSLDIISFGRA